MRTLKTVEICRFPSGSGHRGVIMKLDYKNKKWDKHFTNIKKVIKDLKGELTGAININTSYKNLIENKEPTKQNYYRYLKSCQRNYASDAGTCYVLDNGDYKAVDYTYLSGITGVLASELMGEALEDGNMDLQEAIYELIATDQTQVSYLRDEKELISCIFNQNYEKAKELLDNIQADEEVIEGSYYEAVPALKNIYMAIIEKNERAFNEELQKRIKRYRRNAVGYTTEIDYISVALIKMAKKAGINYTFDVIEIPGSFFDESYEINKEFKLPIPKMGSVP